MRLWKCKFNVVLSVKKNFFAQVNMKIKTLLVKKSSFTYNMYCRWQQVKYHFIWWMAVLLLWIFYVFVLSFVCYVFVRVCLYVLCGHLLGKGWFSINSFFASHVKWRLLSSADNLCKQFWPRSGPTEHCSCSVPKLFDTLSDSDPERIFWKKELWKKSADDNKSRKNYKACKLQELNNLLKL